MKAGIDVVSFRIPAGYAPSSSRQCYPENDCSRRSGCTNPSPPFPFHVRLPLHPIMHHPQPDAERTAGRLAQPAARNVLTRRGLSWPPRRSGSQPARSHRESGHHNHRDVLYCASLPVRVCPSGDTFVPHWLVQARDVSVSSLRPRSGVESVHVPHLAGMRLIPLWFGVRERSWWTRSRRVWYARASLVAHIASLTVACRQKLASSSLQAYPSPISSSSERCLIADMKDRRGPRVRMPSTQHVLVEM